MINLQQDAAGFIRMNRHFPSKSAIEITYTDGTVEVLTGVQLNEVFDKAVTVFRQQNGLDAKGFSRGKPTTVQPKNKIDLLAVHPGMAV